MKKLLILWKATQERLTLNLEKINDDTNDNDHDNEATKSYEKTKTWLLKMPFNFQAMYDFFWQNR